MKSDTKKAYSDLLNHIKSVKAATPDHLTVPVWAKRWGMSGHAAKRIIDTLIERGVVDIAGHSVAKRYKLPPEFYTVSGK